ncbi:MAG: radical SAM protein [Bacteroidales bacterium]|jgi:wyosine [tRNA(Phe)-imidazoG37] synthetase (radical SAM superfamily)|nr:radical SAM protein [Bacteroidales bacterium]
MSAFLFDEIVFGPVQSRRLGVSLGINLLPVACKYCNFDCIYCECGWNADHQIKKNALPTRQEIYAALERKLTGMQQSDKLPDAITFAGNGEPTIHPDFSGIIDDTVTLRNRYAPYSKISVLSNATMLHRQKVADALKKADMPILKLDSAFDTTIQLLNQPAKKISVTGLIEQFSSFGKQCIVQTMFVQGVYRGQTVDNTTPVELDAWEQAILTICPGQVMIYTIARDTPTDTLRKVSGEKLREIAARIKKHGIPAQVSE